MTEAAQPTLTTEEWFVGLAELNYHQAPEVLIAMLGYLTSDLTGEARAGGLAFARKYAAEQGALRAHPPLTIVDTPLATE